MFCLGNQSDLSDEKLKSIGDDYSPELWYDKDMTYSNFTNDVLAQEKISYTHDYIVNLYIIYLVPLLLINLVLTL